MKSLIYSRSIQRESYCSWCAQERTFRRRTADHGLHLILTVVTLGLWGVAWFSIWWGERRLHWRCQGCRRRTRGLLAAPEPPAGECPPPPLESQCLIAPRPEPAVSEASSGDLAFKPLPRVLQRFRGELRRL